jgi:hypothetical protein
VATKANPDVDGNSQQLWQVIQKNKGVDKVKMYRRERYQGSDAPTDEVIEMHLPKAMVIDYMAKGFALKPDDLFTKGNQANVAPVPEKVYACDFEGCEKEFPTKNALNLHKYAAHTRKQTNKTSEVKDGT